MTFCANCGAQLPDGAVFCGNCGSKQPTSQPEQPVYAQPVYSQPEQPVYDQSEPTVYARPTYTQPEQPVYGQPEQPVYTQPEQPVYGQPEQPVYPQPEQPKKKKTWLLLAIIGGVVLVAAIVLLWILVFSKTHVELIEIQGESEIVLKPDETYELTYEVYPEDYTDEIFVESSDEDVVSVRRGKLKAEGVGSCTITVRADSGATAELEVEVKVPVESLYLDISTVTLKPEETYTVSWSATPSDYTEELTWSSTAPQVATVSSDGVITAVGEGSCDIVLQSESGVSESILVYVDATVYVESIELDSYYLSLKPGESYTVSWVVTPSDATEELTWSSSDSSVATVSDSGKITAVASGSCSITLSSESGVSEYVYVDVLEDTYFTDSEAELAACGTWTSYGAYLNDESVEYFGVEMYLYSDNTGTLYYDGDSIEFEWYYDFSDEEVHFYDAYTDDGGYFWFDYYYTGAYEGDLDMCLEEDFWILFER